MVGEIRLAFNGIKGVPGFLEEGGFKHFDGDQCTEGGFFYTFVYTFEHNNITAI